MEYAAETKQSLRRSGSGLVFGRQTEQKTGDYTPELNISGDQGPARPALPAGPWREASAGGPCSPSHAAWPWVILAPVGNRSCKTWWCWFDFSFIIWKTESGWIPSAPFSQSLTLSYGLGFLIYSPSFYYAWLVTGIPIGRHGPHPSTSEVRRLRSRQGLGFTLNQTVQKPRGHRGFQTL